MASNLTSQLNQRLSPELRRLLHIAGEIALEGGQGLYLVGGMVRDLLLGQANLDLDLVVEREAPRLASLLADRVGGKVVTHRRFSTAKLRHQNLTIDLATARAETYSRPGALPTVHPGSIADDLARRDFTINAMAIRLDPDNFGQLVDPFRGEEDLAHKLICVLHPRSFVDDATRMLRAVRYEQRFDFRLEVTTEELLKRDLSMIHTISGDRIRHELELVFKEALPEKPLRRAAELCLLQEIHAALKGNGWITKAFEQARSTVSPPSLGLYLSLAVHHFSQDEAEYLITSLNIPKATARVIQDTLSLRGNMASLEAPQLSPSAIYRLLQDYSPTSILAWAIASESPLVRHRLHLYLDMLRYVKLSLNGQDLQNMGLLPGPRMGQMLKALHEAKLDQKVKTRAEEVALVRRWLSREACIGSDMLCLRRTFRPR